MPHLIDDDNSGVGTQVVVGDINGDGLPGRCRWQQKRGPSCILHEKRSVPHAEWEKAQPKPLPPLKESAAIKTEGRQWSTAQSRDFEDGTLKDWTATGTAFDGHARQRRCR